MPYAFHSRPRGLAVQLTRLRGGLGSGQRGLSRLGELTATTPQQQPLNPWQNAAIGASPSQQPLAYTTPQAAIAAGLDPSKVYDAWRKLVAQYPTPQLAVQAGVPAGVVQELWVMPPAEAPWAERKSLFGLPNGLLAALAIGGFVLVDWKGAR